MLNPNELIGMEIGRAKATLTAQNISSIEITENNSDRHFESDTVRVVQAKFIDGVYHLVTSKFLTKKV